VHIVTAIKRKVKPGKVLFQVFIDEEFKFSLTDLQLSMSGLRVGTQLSEEELAGYLRETSESKAYALALRYLGVRQHSRRELRDYLKRKGCEPSDSDAAIAELEALGLVDDEKFARAWIADRMLLRPRSRMRLAQELAAKGVDRDTADTVLAELDQGSELQTLRNLILRKQKAGYSDQKKLLGYLQRQGYRWDLIKEAMADLELEAD
jgi:regulatory protein